MISIDKISVRRKLLVLFMMIIVFGLISVLTFLHTMNSVSVLREPGQDADQSLTMAPQIDQGQADLNQIHEISFEKQRRHSASLILLMFLNVLIIALVVIYITITNHHNRSRLLDFIKELEKGGRPGKLYLTANNEYGEIAGHLNRYVDKLDEKIRYMKTVGEEQGTIQYEPEKEDLLGKEIKTMAERLKKIRAEEEKRQAADRISNWSSEGIARFAEILRSERENVRELSFIIIQELVSYLNIEMGTIFLTTNDEGDEKMLETIAGYAYDRRKYINKKFPFGEGLPGTCALEKEKIYINEVPEEYSDIISGVGQTKPRYVLLVPLKTGQEIFGILELASFRALERHELTFVDQLAESIASTLQSVQTNERTASLLRQSQEQAEKLMLQEQEMKDKQETERLKNNKL
jgi:methyl-accepting chemotaxis protein